MAGQKLLPIVFVLVSHVLSSLFWRVCMRSWSFDIRCIHERWCCISSVAINSWVRFAGHMVSSLVIVCNKYQVVAQAMFTNGYGPTTFFSLKLRSAQSVGTVYLRSTVWWSSQILVGFFIPWRFRWISGSFLIVCFSFLERVCLLVFVLGSSPTTCYLFFHHVFLNLDCVIQFKSRDTLSNWYYLYSILSYGRFQAWFRKCRPVQWWELPSVVVSNARGVS